MVHPDTADGLGVTEDALVVLGNKRGEVKVHAHLFDGVQPRCGGGRRDLAQQSVRRRDRDQRVDGCGFAAAQRRGRVSRYRGLAENRLRPGPRCRGAF